MANTYKQQKEAWVSGHTGSSVADVNSVSLAMPLSILLWSVIQSRMRLFTPYIPTAGLIDSLLNCGVTLFATTIYSSSPWLLNTLLFIPAALLYITEPPVPLSREAARSPRNDQSKSKIKEESTLDPLPVKPFITNYRGAMMVITCIAILAVDFRVFPRRFAKVENWGTSLMDMGVGSFVFTAGVVSVRAQLKEAASKKRTALFQRLSTSIRHSIPLLGLGTIRLISVKGLDYAEHVSEYGVHWNFFFTLGLIPPFAALCQAVFDLVPSYAAIACGIAVTYEIALDWTTLGSYILVAPRIDLLSRNREGICSFAGYLAIFVAGQSLGSVALPRQPTIPKDAPKLAKFRRSILGRLVATSVFWTLLFIASTSYYGLCLTVSRRLANLPYVLWVASFNSYQIAICCAIESFLFPSLYKASTKDEEQQRSRAATSPLLYAVNRNGLAVFLVANLLTGLVNLTVPTLHLGVLRSMGILVAYTAALAGFAIALDRLNVSIKL